VLECLLSPASGYETSGNIEIDLSDVGDILIDVAGTSGVELTIDNVRDPEKPYRLILRKMRGKKDNGGV